VGSLLCLNSTRNSRRSEIISHFRPGTGPVRSGAVNSHTPAFGGVTVDFVAGVVEIRFLHVNFDL